MGDLLFISRGAILAMFSSRFALTAPTQSAGGEGQLLPIASSSAATQEPMSPTTGAAISTLESSSLGSISIWMNFFGASPQVLPLPCDNSQLRRLPISITSLVFVWTVVWDAPLYLGCGWVKRSFAIRFLRNGKPVSFSQMTNS